MYKFLWAVALYSAALTRIVAQDTLIYLQNPSFEDVPQANHLPKGWVNCSADPALAPDIQPSGDFGVTTPAQHGKTYVAMVYRDNDTGEKISQKLSRPLKAGKCYTFQIHLARAERYIGKSPSSEAMVDYRTPAKLRVYAGFSACDLQYLIAETNPIIHYRWLEYNLRMEPSADYTHLTFVVAYATSNPTNCNVLIDNISPISMVTEDCEEKPEVAKNDPPKKDSTINTPPPVVEQPKTTTEVVINPNFGAIKSEEITKGQTFRMSSITFAVNDAIINRASYPQLDELYKFLTTNSGVVIEIGGHTNGLCDDDYCNQLSQRRAAAVGAYLMNKGISVERLVMKGYGKTQPLSAVKNDPRNQRVDVKILEIK